MRGTPEARLAKSAMSASPAVSCRLSIEPRTRLDALVDAAWEAAEAVFLEPTNDEYRAALRAANAEVDACRRAQEAAS